MSVPKKRTSISRRGDRRSHHHLARSFSVVCPNCAEPVLRHRVCLACGQYRGRQVIEVRSQEVPTETGA